MSIMDELCRMLDERGVGSYTHEAPAAVCLAFFDGKRWHDCWESTGGEVNATFSMTPEQAIAATLGETPTPPPPIPPEQPPYDLLIDLLRDEWDIDASWDGLRRFWYVGWTDEHVRRCESVNLDQDWVRDLIERHSDASGGNGRDFHNGAYAAIADELNATLGSCNCSNDCTNGERTDVPSLPYFWTHDGTLHVELPKLPDSISVRLPDQRDREVGSARVWQFTRDSGTCHMEYCDEWSGDELYPTEAYQCSACGCVTMDGKPNYCPDCGAKVVDE